MIFRNRTLRKIEKTSTQKRMCTVPTSKHLFLVLVENARVAGANDQHTAELRAVIVQINIDRNVSALQRKLKWDALERDEKLKKLETWHEINPK